MSQRTRLQFVPESRELARDIGGGKAIYRYRFSLRLDDVPARLSEIDRPRQALQSGQSGDERWYSTRAASDRSGLSVPELQRLARRGTIDARKVRGRWKIKWVSVLQILDELDRAQ